MIEALQGKNVLPKSLKPILTCVYCGQEYPQGTPPHGDKILTDHIKICKKHPINILIEKLKKKIEQKALRINDYDVPF